MNNHSHSVITKGLFTNCCLRCYLSVWPLRIVTVNAKCVDLIGRGLKDFSKLYAECHV